jgi:hypothetical protein
MRLVDNVMKGDFLQDVYQNIGFVYKIDEVIHIQLLEGPDVGQSTHDLISPVQLTENFLKKNMELTDYHGEVENIFNEYSYEDSDPDGVGIYVRAYNDGTFYAEATDKTGNYSKDIQFVHELQHIFKMFNVKIDWVL